jgi:transposase-like protein
MRTYSAELKDSVLKKMLPPMNRSVPEVAQETGIPKDTLYTWRIQYRRANGVAAAANDKPPTHWSSEEKFAVVMETAALSEVELSEYCRKKGLYPEQVDTWRKACLRANDTAVVPSKAERVKSQAQLKRIEQLETELRRKEKALAEAAALLVLKKKVHALWGEAGDE